MKKSECSRLRGVDCGDCTMEECPHEPEAPSYPMMFDRPKPNCTAYNDCNDCPMKKGCKPKGL